MTPRDLATLARARHPQRVVRVPLPRGGSAPNDRLAAVAILASTVLGVGALAYGAWVR